MTKTLFILKGLDVGGAETYLLRYLRFAGRPSEYVVLCSSGRSGEFSDAFAQVATIVTTMRLGLFPSMRHVNLIGYLRRERFHAVCDFSGNFSAWTLACARLAGVPVRLAFYRESRNQFTPTWWRNFYARCMARLTSFFATRVLANSEEALRHFHPSDCETRHYAVIRNGIDLASMSTLERADVRRSLGIPAEAYVIGHTGRLAGAKNHDMIVQCAIQLCRKHADIYVLLVGNGVSEKYGSQIAALGLSHHIRCLGYRKDVMDILRALDLYYFPSLNEGQPNALIEAMLSGLPVLASDIPAIRETVPPALLPHLVAPTDASQNLQALEACYAGTHPLLDIDCVPWVRQHFDSDRQFQLFKQQLIQ